MDALIARMRWAEAHLPPKRNNKPVSAKTPDEFVKKVAHVIDDIGWFGESPFQPSLKKRPPNPALEDMPYIRRVLISWLVGRPVSQIAARAGCSTRLVHKILTAVIYFPSEPTLPFWRDLGLIALLDVPRVEFNESVWDKYARYGAIALSPWNLLIVFQICHRPSGTIECDAKIRRFDCRAIDAEDLRWKELDWGESLWGPQGHLSCHFFLEGDPIRVSGNPTLDQLAELTGSPKNSLAAKRRRMARQRQHWSLSVDWRVLDVTAEWEALGQPALLPIRDGAEMTPPAAERHWLGLLRGR